MITFNIVGAGKNAGNAPGPASGCANIIANGCSLIHPTVTVFDQNGAIGGVGVGGADLSAWISDFGSVGVSGYKGRSDYNHDGALGGGDLSTWISKFGSGASSGGCSTSYCP